MKAFTSISPYSPINKKTNQIHSILISKMSLAAGAECIINCQQAYTRIINIK